MTLGIMQPYFMPYLGYLALIKQVDHFILIDTVQFIRHGWIERNQILNLNGESMYIKVPLKKYHQKTRIKDIKINNSYKWQDKILAQLVHYKKHAPYYYDVTFFLKQIFNYQATSITDFNFIVLKEILRYLYLDTPITIWSKMQIDIQEVNAPDEWALNICKAMNADRYINPIGGKSFFNLNKYSESNIELKFLEYIPEPYEQFNNDFVPFLSIIDVMMFNDKDRIRIMLDNIILE